MTNKGYGLLHKTKQSMCYPSGYVSGTNFKSLGVRERCIGQHCFKSVHEDATMKELEWIQNLH